jgi:hypothetical protein
MGKIDNKTKDRSALEDTILEHLERRREEVEKKKKAGSKRRSEGRVAMSLSMSAFPLEVVQIQSRCRLARCGVSELLRMALNACEANGWRDVPQVRVMLERCNMLKKGKLVPDVVDKDFDITGISKETRKTILEISPTNLEGSPRFSYVEGDMAGG